MISARKLKLPYWKQRILYFEKHIHCIYLIMICKFPNCQEDRHLRFRWALEKIISSTQQSSKQARLWWRFLDGMLWWKWSNKGCNLSKNLTFLWMGMYQLLTSKSNYKIKWLSSTEVAWLYKPTSNKLLGIHWTLSVNKLPFGYLTVCHGIDGPFTDGVPIKHGDFPWQTVK